MCEKLSKLQLSKSSDRNLLDVLNNKMDDLGRLEPDECYELIRRFTVLTTTGDDKK